MALTALDYDLQTRKTSIVTTWLVILGCFYVPLILFEALYNKTDLDLTVILAICSVGPALSLPNWPIRLYKLLKEHHRRARGTSPWALDLFQWEFAVGIVIVSVLVALGAALPSVHLFLLAPVVLVAEVACQCLLTVLANTLRLPTLFPIDTQPKGTLIRPAGFYVAACVVAVDGAGGADYRERIEARYNASPRFRSTITSSTLIAGVASMIYVGAECGVIFGISSYSAAFAASEGLTIAFVLLLAATLIWHVRQCLRREWAEQKMLEKA